MEKEIREDFKVLQRIFKTAYNKKQQCLLCSDQAINSHVLQKNGILSSISEANHVIQVKGKDFFSADETGILDIKSIGINDAMSYPLFCNFHDTHVFAPIEQKEWKLDEISSQILFSYRALCAEIRKKMINVEIYQDVVDSPRFAGRIQFVEMARTMVEANRSGISDMSWYKDEFEKCITCPKEHSLFTFRKIDFEYIPVSASAVYSPIDPSIHSLEVLQSRKNILNYIFINLIPQHSSTSLVIGYHSLKKDDWIVDYIKSWESINRKEFQLKLTDLLASKIETWCMSPKYFSKLNPQKIELFKRYWNEHAMDLRVTQNVGFNLFA